MNSSPGSDSPTYGAVERRALASVAVQFFVNGAVFASFIPRLPEIRDRIDVSLDTIGILITVALGIGLFGSFSAGTVIERFGTRRVLIVGALALVGAVPVIGFATVPVVFVIGYGLMSIFDVIVDVSMNLQASWLSARRHAPVMNRLHGLWSLGTVVGGLVAARVAAAGVSLQTHLLVVSLVLLAAVLFVAGGLLREDEHVDELIAHVADVHVEASAPETADVSSSPAHGERGSGTSSRKPPPSGTRLGLILLAISGAFAITVELVSSDWAAFRLSEDFMASAGFAGLGYVAFTAGMTIGRLGGDWVLMRLGGERLFRLAIVVSAIGLAGAGLAPNRWVVLVSYTVAGVGIATFFPKLYDDAAQFRGKRGAGLAWMTAGSRSTGLVVPALVGVLAASRLSVGSAIAVITLPCAVGFLIVSVVNARRAA